MHRQQLPGSNRRKRQRWCRLSDTVDYNPQRRMRRFQLAIRSKSTVRHYPPNFIFKLVNFF